MQRDHMLRGRFALAMLAAFLVVFVTGWVTVLGLTVTMRDLGLAIMFLLGTGTGAGLCWAWRWG